MLKKGTGYLTKFDQFLQIDLKKVKTFGTSEHPKKATNAGRPRLPLELRVPRENYRSSKTRRNEALLDGAGLWREEPGGSPGVTPDGSV